ncbi:MAG: hypothetical protein NT062_28240, partial [Proteobacteria bacterium]|nr:hypothetical protein [Pseudomonadota bacterium]
GADAERVTLEGEVATLAVLPARVTIARTSIAAAPEVARAHVGFYDAAYFATKTSGVARKYRDELRAAKDPIGQQDDVTLTIVDGGPLLVAPAPPTRVHRVAGPAPGTLVDRVVVTNAVAFEATFDGARVAIEPDRAQLDRYAREVREVWEAWFAHAGVAAHAGALLYLTRYFTPHPPGEPHFFTKPATLVQTSAGSSTVIEGKPGAGYDVMRGVVRTDGFHATPSVFHLWQVGRAIAVAQGAILAELVPTPRTLIDATFELTAGGAAAARWGGR